MAGEKWIRRKYTNAPRACREVAKTLKTHFTILELVERSQGTHFTILELVERSQGTQFTILELVER
ncbi:MAG: hypothetical protein RR960_07060, partial [Alistipes sp.]